MANTKTRPTSRKKTSTAASSSSGGSGSKGAEHLAAALKLLADRVVFPDEVTKRTFDDHLILATGGENKDQLDAAKDRHADREEAFQKANPA
jgi:hypothetical protein